MPTTVKSMQFGIEKPSDQFISDFNHVKTTVHGFIKLLLIWLPESEIGKGKDDSTKIGVLPRRTKEIRYKTSSSSSVLTLSDLEQKRQAFVNQYSSVCSSALIYKTMSELCDYFLNGGDRIIAPSLFGELTTATTSTPKATPKATPKGSASGKKPNVFARAFRANIITLRRCGVLNIHKDSAQFQYQIAHEIATSLSTYMAQDTKTCENYYTAESAINESLKSLSDSDKVLLKNFTLECIKANWESSFGFKFQSHLLEYAIPAIENGIEVEMYWKDDKGVTHDYSLHPDFYSYLKGKKDLISILKKKEYLSIMEDSYAHSKHYNTALFPIEKPIGFSLGKNYWKFDIECGGATLPDKKNLVFDGDTIDAVDGKTVVNSMYISFGNKTRNYKLKVFYKPKRKKAWWSDISVWKVHKNNNMMFEFLRNNRNSTKVRALVKEPAIVYSSKMNRWLIRFAFTVECDDRSDYARHLSTSLPAKKDAKASIGKDDARVIPNGPVRVLGLDLGVRCPYAYSVLEKSTTGNISVLDSGYRESCEKSFDLLYELLTAKRIVNSLVYGNKPQTKSSSELIKILTKAKGLVTLPGLREDKVASLTSMNVNTFFEESEKLIKKVTLIEAKKNYTFLPNVLLHYFKTEFGKIKTLRKFWLSSHTVDTKFDSDTKILELIDALIIFDRKVRTIGDVSTNSRASNFEKSLIKLRANIRSNHVKQLACEAVSIARNHDCHAIVVENLSGAKSSGARSRRDNRLYASWAPAIFKNALINAASDYGLGMLVEVSETNTSQVHYETEQWGYRDRDKLYYLQGHDVKYVHVDENAAKNIAKRGITRHGNLFTIYSVKDKEEGGKRLKGFMTLKFGDVASGSLSVTNKKVFYNKGKWITKEHRTSLIKSVKQHVFLEKLRASGKGAKARGRSQCASALVDTLTKVSILYRGMGPLVSVHKKVAARKGTVKSSSSNT